MEFIEDFATIQGTLTNIHSTIGDFTSIRHVGGNEEKISRIVDNLSYILSNKKYLKDGKVNTKYEMKLRKINMFLILNTDFYNKSKLTNDRMANLMNIMPQLSKCLLTNVIIKLGLSKFYSEAICSLPVEISLELLENASAAIKKSSAYDMIEQTSQITCAIYYKIHHLRFESVNKVDPFIIKLSDRFGEILKNYVNSINDQILTWPTVKMYQYMGTTILHILELLKSCFTLYFANDYVTSYYSFYQCADGKEDLKISSLKMLAKSTEMLSEFNKSMMVVCESNVVAVTIDVFCSWTECQYNNTQLQVVVGNLAYEVSQLLQKFDNCGDLPMMLNAISAKPKTLQDIIETADESMLLEQVVVKNENQVEWFKALLRHGILKSERAFDTFKTVSHLCDKEDYLKLLELACAANNADLKSLLLEMLMQLSEQKSITVVSEYFNKVGLNSNYETKEFDLKIQELFNKISSKDINEVPLKEIVILLVQNPDKFVAKALDESLKSVAHISDIIYIFNFVKPVCVIKREEMKNSVLFEQIVHKLKQCGVENKTEKCMIELVHRLLESELLNTTIVEELWKILEDSMANNDLRKSAFICRICNTLPSQLLKNVNIVPIILKLASFLCEMRCNFFTYSEDKVLVSIEIIHLINEYKTHLPDNAPVELEKAASQLNNRINSYHVIPEHTRACNKYLSYVSVGYDKEANHNEQVCRLLKLLPSCVPEEWELSAKYLIIDKNPLDILQLYTDLIMILSEMSKKSCDNSNSLSYCFQQVCIIIKDVIYPLVKNDKECEKTFIKTICTLIKHLPNELHNSIEVSLVNLFNLEVLKLMKEDEEFLYNLVSISHLNICKIICSKMT